MVLLKLLIGKGFNVSRSELKSLVHHLRVYLEHERRIGTSGIVAAPVSERDAFEALIATRRKREIQNLTRALKSPSPGGAKEAPQRTAAPPQARPQQPSSSQSQDASPDRVMPQTPDFLRKDRSRSSDAPPPAAPGSGAPLWKQLGARPQTILKKTPEQQPPPPTPPPAAHATPAVQDDAPSKPAFKEVRRRDDRPPSKRPKREPAEQSLFGAEWERANRPRLPAIPGFDSSPEQAQRLEHMTHGEKLSFLRECLGDCRRCKLSQERSNIVFGDGDPNAEIVFVGEGPGYHEDRQGIPFVGKAGQLLNKMIFAMGIERADVYIANVVKCRPPNNRDPAPDEIAHCSPFLYKQLETINPKVIITLGRFASQCLLDTNRSMGSMRGRWQDWRGVEVMPTYHPAFLLRNPDSKREAWSDLKLVMEKLGLEGRS